MTLPNAFITLLTTSSYLPGALVLLHAIHDLHPAPRDFKIVCLVTPETVDARTIGEVRKAGFDLVIGVEPIGSGVPGQDALDLMGRPDLNLALTKLHLFRLAPLFSTLIYLDADVLPLRPLSHLFDTTVPHRLSACPDTGWPDCFNSGVMVIRPREDDWEGLRGLLRDGEGADGMYAKGSGNGSFDGADQGLLNEWFSAEGGGEPWNRLPFTYNVTPTAAYTYAPAYRRYGHKINAVHFIGPHKPWASLGQRPAGMSRVTEGKEQTYDYPALVDRWYAVYDKHVRPTAAHTPDIAARFAVPENVAVWNQSIGVPAQPEDRLDLNDLKLANEWGISSIKTGQYTSLPLEGRIDLIMPKPRRRQPPRVTITEPSPPESTGALPPHSHSSHEAWDGSRSAPPAQSGPEMATPISTHYRPAWEQPASTQASYYRQSQRPEPEYPVIPANVRQDEWYKQFTSSEPRRSAVHAVFPWEQSAHSTPSRVFPREESAQSTHPLRQRPTSLRSQDNQLRQTPRTMSEAMAQYTNAWDTDPSIQRYIASITNEQTHSSRREALQSVPTTPHAEYSSMQRELSASAISEAAHDGDDEDDGESTDHNSSPSFHSREVSNDEELLYASNSSYRDRQIQTDRPTTYHAQVQTSGGSTPIARHADLSRRPETTLRKPSSQHTQPTIPFPVRSPNSSTSSSRRSSYHSQSHSLSMTSGQPESPPSASRQFDPNTSLDSRKKDTQEVLSRLMRERTKNDAGAGA